MSIRFVGSLCARRGCNRPSWKDALCHACWRLARLFGKDPQLFAYEPLHPYADARDSVPLPWERWEQEARARGATLADLLAQAPQADDR